MKVVENTQLYASMSHAVLKKKIILKREIKWLKKVVHFHCFMYNEQNSLFSLRSQWNFCRQVRNAISSFRNLKSRKRNHNEIKAVFTFISAFAKYLPLIYCSFFRFNTRTGCNKIYILIKVTILLVF